MAATYLANRVRVSTATTGQGTLALSAAAYSNASCSFSEAGVPDGATVRYLIEEGTDFEIGTGVYSSSGATLTRPAVTLSKIAGTAGTTKMTLLGTATVRVIAAAEDVAPYLFTNLPADVAGTNVNTAQPWTGDTANDGVTVADDTTYRFSGQLHLTRAAGTTSHTTSIGFAGTATVASIRAISWCITGDTAASTAANGCMHNSTTSTVIKAASTSATEVIALSIEGTVRFSGPGTFIPQFTYSAAPGGVPTIKANTFFEMVPIGTDAIASVGTWS